MDLAKSYIAWREKKKGKEKEEEKSDPVSETDPESDSDHDSKSPSPSEEASSLSEVTLEEASASLERLLSGSEPLPLPEEATPEVRVALDLWLVCKDFDENATHEERNKAAR